MNNIILFFDKKKAGLLVCLLLFLPALVWAQEWSFDDATQRAYDRVLNLETETARFLIPEPKTAQEHYVIAFAEAIELLLTEDPEKFSDYEDQFEQRMERKSKVNDPNDIFLQAEIHLQWAFVYLKFGHEFDAALHFRESYLLTREVRKKFPKYQAIKKTSGLLDVIIGSIPEKYNWVLGLLNMEGAVALGLEDLETLRRADHPLAFEADLLYALTKGFILQQTEEALTAIKRLQQQNPTHRTVLLLGASLAVKHASSEEGLAMLHTLSANTQGLPLYYADYLRGEIYLQKGEYLNSISAFRAFINHYKGQNQMKDAHYKIGLCYWLNGNKNDALAVFKQAKNIGKEASEADKYASRSLAEGLLPHIKLTKARFYTDGGYYDDAQKMLASISTAELVTARDQVEYYYRKARLAHKLNDIAAARQFYLQTIEANGAGEWYFAPNACLQCGYLAMAEKDFESARTYFTRALSYKKHEYKNSIDSKAKSALAQLRDRK